MKLLVAWLTAATLVAQVPRPGPGSGGTAVNLPPFAPVSNAGTDVICALHADVITGLTCNNAVVDGTTETAFATVATLGAGSLSSAVTTLNMNFGIIENNGAGLTLRVRYGTISGTILFQGNGDAPPPNVPSGRSVSLSCVLTVVGRSPSSPAIFSCPGDGTLGVGILVNTVISNSALSIPINPTIASALTITAQWGANSTQNAIWLYSISSTPAGSTATAGGLLTAQTTLSAAQINAMFTTPVLLIPAQGPGTVITLNRCIFNAVFGSAAFTGGGVISLFFSATSPPVSLAMNVITASLLTTFSASQISSSGVSASVILSTAALNTGVYVSNQTGVFAGGAGSSMTVACQYTVLSGMQ